MFQCHYCYRTFNDKVDDR